MEALRKRLEQIEHMQKRRRKLKPNVTSDWVIKVKEQLKRARARSLAAPQPCERCEEVSVPPKNGASQPNKVSSLQCSAK